MAAAQTTRETSIIISPRKLRDDLYQDQQHSNTPLVISVLASLIDRTVARNQRIASNFPGTPPPSKDRRHIIPRSSTAPSSTVFDCHETPNMSVQSYMERIFRYTGAGPSVYVVAYVYIDRLCHLHPHFRIGPRNVHRLLITAILLASKYVEDMNYRNSYFARVGGLGRKEMNKLEVKLLFMMGFKLHVNVSVFQSYCCHLEREVSNGGGYHIERTLRCAQEIKSKRQTAPQHHKYSLTLPRLLL